MEQGVICVISRAARWASRNFVASATTVILFNTRRIFSTPLEGKEQLPQ